MVRVPLALVALLSAAASARAGDLIPTNTRFGPLRPGARGSPLARATLLPFWF